MRKEKFKQDILALEKDWEKLLTRKELAFDQTFLKGIAKHIKSIHEDTYLLNDEHARMLHHLIATPWGAPFVAKSTLLEAALNFEEEDAKNSDLCHLMEEFTRYSSISHNQFLTILRALSKEI